MRPDSMENKSDAKSKAEKNHSSSDDFILNLIDVNAGFDLKSSSEN
jgi:hypothetical protein